MSSLPRYPESIPGRSKLPKKTEGNLITFNFSYSRFRSDFRFTSCRRVIFMPRLAKTHLKNLLPDSDSAMPKLPDKVGFSAELKTKAHFAHQCNQKHKVRYLFCGFVRKLRVFFALCTVQKNLCQFRLNGRKKKQKKILWSDQIHHSSLGIKSEKNDQDSFSFSCKATIPWK